ncbi:LacI family transcriptional regulator [Microbacterium sp. zg.Y1090]|uniref:LacI family DNA-binding transcriptional regulator n=1 Tax=Microbacterium TaxID=33882 RepID=UPI00214D08FA|nr:MULTISPECIES: LacI family DNA-binding transcriptional regulator [unclassified Microbacterium]MCR2812410.1 LacI family transcriptional regulator [Microbacterium sp. zg.Y1084]MCR2817789.1 LacI family transcriptional regulator [Microbacterium sp. zg.Y1090]MDL5485567.1 LacI family DNA-binding transcriptional regulator [Microbacterium sp. zg-Y1211]WIM28738.1 LacI family DNA-binding transcriptional regulator [Microbacterium sp. zg-Y1090]
MSRPTLVDVAHAAGVSRATAARVLAGATNVDPAMSVAVEREARRLGYETNFAARVLRGGRSGAIGIVIALNELDSVGGSFFTAVLKGAAKGLSAGEAQPVLLPAEDEDRDRIPRFLRSGALDGVIVILQHEITHLVAQLAQSPVPIAWVGRPAEDVGSDAVVIDCDNYGGGVLAAQALVDAGRRTIGIIAGPPDMAQAQERLQGCKDELARHGVVAGPVVHGDFTADSGSAAMARLLQRAPGLDGVFACSDLMASGGLRVLQAAGRRVPDEVSLVGFDDVVVAVTSDPPLTTVRQPLEEMGRAAAEALLARIEGRAEGGSIVLPTTLVRRETLI